MRESTAVRGSVERGAERMTLTRGELAVDVGMDPFSLGISRAGRVLLDECALWAQTGSGRDRLITLTEGVVPEEERGEPEVIEQATVERASSRSLDLRGHLAGGRPFWLTIALRGPEEVLVELSAGGRPFRLGAEWASAPGERLTGLGARHGIGFDQSGRRAMLGADRRYTGPDCPEDMLDAGGIPQGDCAPVPWLLSSNGWGLWVETWGAGTELALEERVAVSVRGAAGSLRLNLVCDPTPAARLRHYCALTGFPPVLPEWGYGFWKSRDVYEHQDDVIEDFEGHLANAIPLDAIVIDSPWETQYNTWRFNPHQFPDPAALIRRMRAEDVRTVVWTTPWVNVESADGQRPPDAASERLHLDPATNYEEGASRGHFVGTEDGRPHLGRWWMGTGSPVDFTSTPARRWWQKQARAVLEMGVEGIKADDGEGYYLPPDVRFADGQSGARAAWAYPELYARAMQEALDETHPGRGVLFARSGWAGRQSTGVLWGGDQASDFWSLRALVAATLTAAASGISNWSHDVGGYLGERLVERCPKELLLRWAQFGCFTPLMHAHGRFRQEAWTYDAETLSIYREFVLLHERLVPYVRAAAATAERCGLPIVRPLCLTDRDDPRGWTISDAYGYGPALWVAPVLERGARERRVHLPRGSWIDWWTGERHRGGAEIVAEAPVDRIPVWVRSGSIVVTYPEEYVAEGLGEDAESTKPIEATLWGRPALGRTVVRLADGTAIRWTRGEWSVSPSREIRTRER